MTHSICPFCGKQLAKDMAICSCCNTTIPLDSPHTASTSPLSEVADYLQKARKSLRQGNVSQALCLAREALTLDGDDSCTHALLGQLYTLQDNISAAQYHFQSALHVNQPPEAETECIPAAFTETTQQRHQHPAIILLVLMSCIFLSGFAALYALHPRTDSVFNKRQSDFAVTAPPALSTTPRWTWHVPQAIPDTAKLTKSTTPSITPTPDTSLIVANSHSDDPALQPATQDEKKSSALPDTVLGPEAHTQHRINEANSTMAEADKAYFGGDYERAIILYENVLADTSTPQPQLYQDLAWCYQQLGNSQQAASNLQLAINGYRTLIASNADNSTAQQDKAACETALQSLLSTRNMTSPN